VATFNALEGFGAPGSSDYEASKAILARINADVVGFQELTAATATNWDSLGIALNYAHRLIQTVPAPLSGKTQAYVGFFSRYPIVDSSSVRSPQGAEEMVRFPLRVTIDVPKAAKPLVVWTVHHKSSSPTGGLTVDSFRRAIEAYRVVRDIAAYRASNPGSDELVVLGDFNDNIFTSTLQTFNFTGMPSPLPSGYRLGADVPFPIVYRSFPDSYYVSSAGLFRLAAAQQNGSLATFPSSGRTLDYIYVSADLRNSQLGEPVAEIYNSALDANFSGLPKLGQALPSGTSSAASDHLAVFADIRMKDAAAFVVSPVSNWSVSGYEQGPFSPGQRDFVVSNNSAGPVSWSVESDQAWIEFQPSSGSVPAQSSVTVRASIGAGASALSAGRFKAAIRFRPSSSQEALDRTLEMTVLRRTVVSPSPSPAPSPTPPPELPPTPAPSPSPLPVTSPSPAPVGSPTPLPSPASSPPTKPSPSPAPSPTPKPWVPLKKSDAVKWSLPPATYGDPVVAIVSKTTSGRVPVFRSSDPKVVTIRGDLMTIRGAGRATISATLPADREWEALAASCVLEVAKARQTVVFRPPAELPFVARRTFGLRAASTAKLPVTIFVSSNPSVVSVRGNVATILGKGRVKLTALQLGNANYARAQAVRWVTVKAKK
jgi:endonuclease/exonuclease/phosphatase family metal-dependent hydrolase